QPIVLEKAITTCDVAIGAMRAEDGRSPCIVTESTVSRMKPNAVIIDVSIDRGGCFETSRLTSHEQPVFKKYDVLHYCVPNIASAVSRTASRAISNVLMPILQQCADMGGVEDVISAKSGIRRGVYMYKGCVTNAPIAKRFNFKYTDLDLLLASHG
ncbi:MAG: alanine dehydrogenase, partial [Gammaproteobacteria bacterium]